MRVDVQLARNIQHDPFEALNEYAGQEPFWADGGDFYDSGFWVVTKFDQCREVLQDAETFASETYGQVLLPTSAAPPELQKLRGILLPHLSRGKVLAMDERIRTHARSYISEFEASGSCEFVSDFAQVYPIAVFGELFGLDPEKSQEFRRLAEGFLHSYHAERDAYWAQILRIVGSELIDRRTHPRDDLLTGIATSMIDDKPVDDETGVNLASTVFLGGLDTLPSNLGWAFRYLARNPGARERLLAEDGVKVASIVEEFLRVYPVVAKERRQLCVDKEFHGVEMKAGDRVVLLVSAANRDELEFANAGSVDFDRQANRHISFGVGPHRCLGSHLARHELGIAVTEWHKRIPDYQISPSAEITYNGGILAVASLPLEWDVAANSARLRAAESGASA